MNYYDAPPSCQQCGGGLEFASQLCPCGGRSQYVLPERVTTLANMRAELDRRRDPPSDPPEAA